MSTTALEAPAGVTTAAPARRRLRLPFSRRTALVVAAAVALALAGVAYIAWPKGQATTDAAYVQADSSIVAPKVRGLVEQVLVGHNQVVRAGQPLVKIDPEEFDARVASAEADLQNAQAGVQAAQAALTALGADQRLAAANVRAAQTAISSADAQRQKADADRARYDNLVASGAVAQRDADAVRAAAITAQSDAEHTRAELDVSRNQAAVVLARRATLQAGVAEAQAQVARAQAALALARQDQDHAIVRSPIDGVVGDRQVEPGDYVQPGGRMMTVVPLNDLYIVADFKETQVSRMAPGQAAVISVDALPGVRLRGVVDSFAPGSGSQFSLLPFEPGTGNFTKIVQRVPVRIRFDPGQADLARLRPGLSTTVTVRFSQRRD